MLSDDTVRFGSVVTAVSFHGMRSLVVQERLVVQVLAHTAIVQLFAVRVPDGPGGVTILPVSPVPAV